MEKTIGYKKTCRGQIELTQDPLELPKAALYFFACMLGYGAFLAIVSAPMLFILWVITKFVN